MIEISINLSIYWVKINKNPRIRTPKIRLWRAEFDGSIDIATATPKSTYFIADNIFCKISIFLKTFCNEITLLFEDFLIQNSFLLN